jgi:hypothetical protein
VVDEVRAEGKVGAGAGEGVGGAATAGRGEKQLHGLGGGESQQCREGAAASSSFSSSTGGGQGGPRGGRDQWRLDIAPRRRGAPATVPMVR